MTSNMHNVSENTNIETSKEETTMKNTNLDSNVTNVAEWKKALPIMFLTILSVIEGYFYSLGYNSKHGLFPAINVIKNILAMLLFKGKRSIDDMLLNNSIMEKYDTLENATSETFKTAYFDFAQCVHQYFYYGESCNDTDINALLCDYLAQDILAVYEEQNDYGKPLSFHSLKLVYNENGKPVFMYKDDMQHVNHKIDQGKIRIGIGEKGWEMLFPKFPAGDCSEPLYLGHPKAIFRFVSSVKLRENLIKNIDLSFGSMMARHTSSLSVFNLTLRLADKFVAAEEEAQKQVALKEKEAGMKAFKEACEKYNIVMASDIVFKKSPEDSVKAFREACEKYNIIMASDIAQKNSSESSIENNESNSETVSSFIAGNKSNKTVYQALITFYSDIYKDDAESKAEEIFKKYGLDIMSFVNSKSRKEYIAVRTAIENEINRVNDNS